MRRFAISFVVLSVVATSCSSGSSDDAAPDATPATTATESGEASEPTEPPVTDPAITEPPPEVIPAPVGDTAYEQLENLRDTGTELDVALAEFAAIVGPVPGVPTLAADGTVFPSLTHVLDIIEARRSELTAEQADAVDAALAELFDPASIVIEFPLFDDASQTETGAEATNDGEGFARRGLRSGPELRGTDEPDLEEAPEDIQRAVRSAGEALRATLGGPPLNIWVQMFPLGALADVAGRNIGLHIADSRRGDFPTGPDCLLQIASGAVAADIAGIVAHEITHCWQFTRLGFDVDRYNATDDWVLEGSAAYVGQVVGGISRFNDNWWDGYLRTQVDFNGQWNMYASSYDAIGFWSRLAEGGDAIAAIRRALDASPSNSRMFSAATSELGSSASWLGAGTFQRADWGGAWTASGPGLPNTPRESKRHTVIERNDIALDTVAGAQSNHEIAVSPVDGADGSVLTIQGTGRGVLRLEPDDVVLFGAFQEEWCLGVCECPDGSPAFPADRIEPGAVEVAASLVGQSSNSTTLRARVGRFDPEDPDRCNEEEEEAEPAPAPSGDVEGLLGTWLASPLSVAAMFEQASAFGADATAFDVLGADGDVLMTFAEGGSGSLVYDSVTLFLADAIIGDLTISGSGTFAWAIVGGNVQISGTEFAYAVSSSALGGELLTITDEDVPTSGTTTLSGGVSGNSLIFASADGSEGRVFFPTTWTRQ